MLKKPIGFAVSAVLCALFVGLFFSRLHLMQWQFTADNAFMLVTYSLGALGWFFSAIHFRWFALPQDRDLVDCAFDDDGPTYAGNGRLGAGPMWPKY